MKTYFDRFLTLTLCCSLVLVFFLSLNKATASTQNQLDVMEEENNNNSKEILSTDYKPHKKLVRRHMRTPYFPLSEREGDAPISVEDLSSSFNAITLSDKPSEEFLSFSTPISFDKLLIDFGKLPQKLSKHRKTYDSLFTKDRALLIAQFIKDLDHLVANQLLLRADNLDLFLSLEALPEDYAALSLFNTDLDETTRNDYMSRLIFHYNDIPAKVSPRYSRFQNQWSALAIIKEEVFDYTTAQRDCLGDTELLSSQVIGLTIKMVRPFYDFVMKYEQLMSDMEEERAQFFHLMHKHSGVTKKNIQFEQAVSGFSSLIHDFKKAKHLAKEREVKERIAQEQTAQSENADSVPESKKLPPVSHKSSSGQEGAKRSTTSLRSTLSLDLTWLNPTHGKHSKTVAPKNLTQSTGDVSSVGEQKNRFSSPRKHSPKFISRKRTISGGESPQDIIVISSTQEPSPSRERISLSDESHHTQDSAKISPAPRKISSPLESPSTGKSKRKGHSLHGITTSDSPKNQAPLTRKSSASDSPTHPLPHHAQFSLELQTLELWMQQEGLQGDQENSVIPTGEPSLAVEPTEWTTVTNGLSNTMDPLFLPNHTSPLTEQKKRATSPRELSPRVHHHKQKLSQKESSSLSAPTKEKSTKEPSPRKTSSRDPSPKVEIKRLVASTGDLETGHHKSRDTAPLRPKIRDNGPSSTLETSKKPLSLFNSQNAEEK